MLDIDTTARDVYSGSFTFRVCFKTVGDRMVFAIWPCIWAFRQRSEGLHESQATSPCSGLCPPSNDNRDTGPSAWTLTRIPSPLAPSAFMVTRSPSCGSL